MSSIKNLRYGFIIFGALLLLACQMPVKSNKISDNTKPQAIEAVIAVPSQVLPEQIADTTASTMQTPDVVEPASAEFPEKQNGEAVFARLRNNFSGPICKDSAGVNQWKKRYAGNPKAFSNHLAEILPLLDYVSSEVDRRNLPAEFALIPIIESWYQPSAVGSGGPSGMWQMIGSTAKNHGVKIQAGYDGRFSVVDSTDAALSYLGTLQGMFKDWQRAVMGYNAGEFRILRAIRNSGNKSEGEDFWPHGLSPITYAYIAKLQALSCLISQPEKNNLSLPNSTEFTPLKAVLVSKHHRSLVTIAKHYQINPETLKRNNPAYRHDQISANAPRRILMPAYVARTASADTAETSDDVTTLVATTIEAAVEVSKNETKSVSHQVQNGDTLWSVAKRYRMSLLQLIKLNGLGQNSVLRIGQTLKISP